MNRIPRGTSRQFPAMAPLVPGTRARFPYPSPSALPSKPNVTQLLVAIDVGDPRGADDSLPLVHGELRRCFMAASYPSDEFY